MIIIIIVDDEKVKRIKSIKWFLYLVWCLV